MRISADRAFAYQGLDRLDGPDARPAPPGLAGRNVWPEPLIQRVSLKRERLRRSRRREYEWEGFLEFGLEITFNRRRFDRRVIGQWPQPAPRPHHRYLTSKQLD